MVATAPHIIANSAPRAGQPPLTPAEGVDLAVARAHEVTGPSRRYFALLAAAACTGPVFWVAPAWCRVRPNPPGLSRWLDPARITYVTPDRADDVLWSLEETLRTGIVPLVVADLPGPPGMVSVRRLHLTAEAGAANGTPPVALLMTPEGAAPGIESRWSLSPACTAGRMAWRVERLRARTLPQKAWDIDATGRAVVAA
ncbi:hypothetical protein PARPLA_02627 [Rhodobacteraceae bacterium THAF1]|uniref:ImuA family protein n=1 Tax=Palleronia sp. THAF1 TaxID=2587842 RepID=UPI000F4038EB|nr:hypothetical protein [Palleronia sp. THAF1]QFU08105.1 hypothetical protein FIU81_05410 [Palleronia sp. THAF1]VDC27971.1 hypothetical protein PARPLA_02627 [Rhodobacteraceae bacterium THAF1]